MPIALWTACAAFMLTFSTPKLSCVQPYSHSSTPPPFFFSLTEIREPTLTQAATIRLILLTFHTPKLAHFCYSKQNCQINICFVKICRYTNFPGVLVKGLVFWISMSGVVFLDFTYLNIIVISGIFNYIRSTKYWSKIILIFFTIRSSNEKIKAHNHCW